MTEQLMAANIARSISPSAESVTDLNAAERELDIQISRINELVSDLGSRLNRILRQPNEKEEAMARPIMSMDSDISTMIMASADRIRRIANEVDQILRRVDL